jgi:hypothetical protein
MPSLQTAMASLFLGKTPEQHWDSLVDYTAEFI